MNMQIIPSFDIRNAFRDPRSAWFQDDIRRAMIKGMAPVKEAPPPPMPREPRAPGVVPSSHADNCRAILRHLAEAEDSRANIAQMSGLAKRTLDRALRDLRDKGRAERLHKNKIVTYRITPDGADWLAEPQPAQVSKGAAFPKKSPSANKIDRVFALLSKQPASRAAMQRALGMSRSAIDDCLRLLRVQGLIVWVQDPMSSIKTYSVKA